MTTRTNKEKQIKAFLFKKTAGGQKNLVGRTKEIVSWSAWLNLVRPISSLERQTLRYLNIPVSALLLKRKKPL